ncbi:hypothetical protein TSAR_014469, partial [Trichomalopsis sarcophagae]
MVIQRDKATFSHFTTINSLHRGTRPIFSTNDIDYYYSARLLDRIKVNDDQFRVSDGGLGFEIERTNEILI